MSLPINSNLQSKKCGSTLSSNCVVYDGPPINGLCKGASMTEAIYRVSECACNDTETGSCYTGEWIDFSSAIPTSGIGSILGGGYNWTISELGYNFRGIPGTGSGAENTPEYKWTKDGDLKIRGTFSFNIIATGAAPNAFFQIPLVTLPSNCFPSSWNKSQTTIVAVDLYPLDQQRYGPFVRGFLTIDYPTGILYLSGSYDNGTLMPSFTHRVFMGGTTFNLA